MKKRELKVREREGTQTKDREMWPLQVHSSEGQCVLRKKGKRKFPLEDNSFGQAHNSFIRGFTLSVHGR